MLKNTRVERERILSLCLTNSWKRESMLLAIVHRNKSLRCIISTGRYLVRISAKLTAILTEQFLCFSSFSPHKCWDITLKWATACLLKNIHKPWPYNFNRCYVTSGVETESLNNPRMIIIHQSLFDQTAITTYWKSSQSFHLSSVSWFSHYLFVFFP